MQKQTNAFLLYGYNGPEYFCGRTEELTQLKNHKLNERNVTLYSWRGMGRSALIHRFLLEEERKGRLEAITVDLTGTIQLNKCVEVLLRSVFERYNPSKTEVDAALQQLLFNIGANLSFSEETGTPQFELGFQNESRLVHNLNTIGKFLSNRKKKVFLVFKEFQQIVNYDEKNIETILANFTQQFSAIRFIFSGSHRQKMVAMFTDSQRPFYKKTQLLPLDPIPLREYIPFIQQHFSNIKRKITPKLIEEIYSWTRGQTQSIQLICNKLYETDRPIESATLRAIFHEVLQENALVFANYHRLLTKVQWKLILAVAKENGVTKPQSAAFLSKYNLGAASSIKVAMDSLTTKELMVFEGGEYYVQDLLFSRWLEQH